MPKVTGKKKSKSGSRGRGRKKQPDTILERLGALCRQVFHLFVTYTAVAVVGLIIIAFLMLFAGGYFSNFGSRLVELSKDTTKAAGLEVTRLTWSGATQTSELDVMDALFDERDGGILHQSILHFSPGKAMHRIEELGWVRHAAVTRLLPNTIHISIDERVPAALWQRNGSGRLFLIDRDGVVITEVGGHQYTGLPLIIDTDDPASANRLLRALGDYPELSARIANLRYRGERRWDIGFRNGFEVMLPEDNYEKAIDKISVLESQGKLSKSMEKLDLRLPNAVYYVPKQQ